MKNHVLKCWPKYFADVVALRKKFEARRNDRDFKEGDTLELREYEPESKNYTGRRWFGVIGYVLDTFPCGLPQYEGFCVFSIAPRALDEARAKNIEWIGHWFKRLNKENPTHTTFEIVWEHQELTDAEVMGLHDDTGLFIVLLPGRIRAHVDAGEANRCRQRPDAIPPRPA